LYLVAGLGNKGARYAYTRHNIGYLVVDRFADKHSIALKQRVFGCIVGKDAKENVVLAKPDTFMNLSGGPVSSVLGWAGVPREQLIVVHDDMDMEFGRIRIRWDGGDGGHKGVRSIVETLGSPFFYRIKVGIGRDPIQAPEEYVLSRFPKDCLEELVAVLDRVTDAIHMFVHEGKEKAMNVYNRTDGV
jgi:PTH1 family peptidyl-tRNA hydrolase